MVSQHAQTGRPVASRYAGVAGVPAVFGARDLPALASLRGDTGARALLAALAFPTVDWPDGALDIDVARDVLRIRA